MKAEFMEELFYRHEKVALQLSGGKDSLACLYLMKPFWDKLTVYWLNTGAAFPETVALMGRIKAMVPNFVEIAGNQPGVIAQFGIPSDIVPVSSTPIGVMAAGAGTLIQDRYSCCAMSLMIPLHERMVQDGITCIIRGQKNADKLKGPLQSGEVVDGIELICPIEDWTDEQAIDYLREDGRELPAFYGVLHSSPDCVNCSAYWEEGRAKYLQEHHPIHFQTYQARLNTISEAVAPHIAAFNMEIGK